MDISLNYKGWHLDIMYDEFHRVNQVTITKDLIADNRTYNIVEEIEKVEHSNEYVYIYVEGGDYYQFKFEDGDFIVGDKFDSDDELIEEFAHYILGED